ncbi:hypothetical protein ACVIHH_001240 [Bradyrhizobium sp. USDA 4518]
MKDIFCVAVFAGELLGLAIFVSVLRPDAIVAVKASMEPACKIERSRWQGCGKLAAASGADVAPCRDRSGVVYC